MRVSMDDPNFKIAEMMGYIPESDNELEFEFRSEVYNYGVTTVPKTQMRTLFDTGEGIDVEVKVWTMINSASHPSKGRAVMKAKTNCIELSWSEGGDSEGGELEEVNMSADLWELTFSFKDVDGLHMFEFCVSE